MKETAKDWQEVAKPVWSVYCDGSSTGQANREGGYGWVILKNGEPMYAGYGGDPHTTNNIMELTAAIVGMEALLDSGKWDGKELIEIVSDSQYTLGIANGTYSPQKNMDLAQRLRELAQSTGAQTRWVRGHSGKDPWNERCDSLAKKGKLEYVK